MKLDFTIIFTLFIITIFSQQSDINGIVSIHNSETKTGKRVYVFNAEILADSERANRTITDNLGRFKLTFIGVNESSLVSFKVRKKPLQVVNLDALQAIAGQEDTIKISMALPGEIAEYRRLIYNVGKTAAEKSLEALLRKKKLELQILRKNLSKNEEKINQLESEVARLKEHLNKIDEQAKELANKYAFINLDDLTPLFKKAFLLFQNGKLDSALSVLNKAALPNKVELILSKKAKLNIREAEIALERKNQKKEITDLTDLLHLKLDLHLTLFEFDSLSNSLNLLLQLAPDDSLNIERCLGITHYLYSINEYELAINFFNKLLPYEKDSVMIAYIYHALGEMYFRLHSTNLSEKYFIKSLEIKYSLKPTNEIAVSIAATKINLSALYTSIDKVDLAEKILLEAIELLKQSANSSIYFQLSSAYHNLAIGYCRKRQFQKGITLFQQSINSFPSLDSLSLSDGKTLFMTVHDYATCLTESGRLFSADSFMTSYEPLLNSLYKKTPYIYEFSLVWFLKQQGIICEFLNKNECAEKKQLRALSIIENSKLDEPLYEDIKSNLLLNIGVIYDKTEANDLALKYFLKCLSLREELFKKDSAFFLSKYASILKYLGKFYIKIKDPKPAIEYLLKAKGVYEELYKDNKAIYWYDLMEVSNALDVLHVDHRKK